jgi:hypothetical protein
MAVRRNPEEVEHLLDEYKRTEMTRAEFCRQQGVSIYTLDYYLRRQVSKAKPRFARVRLAAAAPTIASCNFTLTLCNGRRIESGWNFDDAMLARLIRIAEEL